ATRSPAAARRGAPGMRPLRSGPGAPRRATADNKGRLEGHFDKHHQDDAFQPSLQQCRQVTPVTARSHGGVVRARSGGLAAPSPPRAGGHARAKLSVTPSRRSRGRTLRDGWMLTRLLTTGPDDRGRVWMCRRLRPWSGDRCGCPWTVLILLRIRRLGVRIPSGAPTSEAPSDHGRGLLHAVREPRWEPRGSQDSDRAPLMASAAARLSSTSRCPYTSFVIEVDVCPRISETACSGVP